MAALVGRDEEQRLARDVLARPAPTGVLFAGAMGVGKTALARAVVEDAGARGWATAWTVGTTSGATIPLGALEPLFPDVTAESVGLLRDPDGIRAARLAITGRAAGLGLVIGVDDAHLLDPASAVVILQLLSAGAASVVATVRSGEPAPDAVVALWKDGLVERTELQTLSRGESAALIGSQLEGRVEAALVDSLWQLSAGNPLYLRELVLAGRAAGRIALHRGHWSRQGTWAVGSRLVELVAARLGDLSHEALDVVEMVAVAEVVPLVVLARLAPGPAIEEAERRGLIRTEIDTAEPQVRSAHPLYGEVARTGLPGARVMAVRKRLADALEETGLHAGSGLLSFVTWRIEAGVTVPAGLLATASVRACQRGDPALGERLGRVAIEQGGGREAGLALAMALHLEGRGEDALAAIKDIETSDDDERSEVADLRASILQLCLDRPVEAEAVLHEAEALIVDPQCLARLAATRVALLAYGNLGPELDYHTLTAGDPRSHARRFALNTLGPAFALSGRTGEAIGAAEEALAGGASLIEVFPTLFTSYVMAGRVDELESLARLGYERATDQNDTQWQALSALGLGLAAMMRGKVRSAMPSLREAAAGTVTVAGVAQTGIRTVALSRLAEAAALVGDLDGAKEALQAAETQLAQELQSTVARVGPMLVGARAALAVARGERSRAVGLVRQGLDAIHASGMPAFELRLLHTMVSLGAAQEVAERAGTLAKSLDGPYARLVAALAKAVATADGDGIDRAADGFEAASMLLDAAGAAAQASTAHARAGRAGRAVASRYRAERLLACCEGARGPWLSEALPSSPLTAREEEVATLAAAGLPSREIARRLVVSVRTVDSHLASVYGKLGVSGRQDLARSLGSSPGSAK